MIKLLHAADFHLDSAFSSLRPEQAAQRRQEQRLALQQLSQLAQDCHLVLLAGDLFDSAQVYLDTVEALKRFFASVPCPVIIAPGNHDAVTEGSPYLREDWGENVRIFTSGQIQRLVLPELGCHLYGAAFTAREMPSLLENFRVEDPTVTNIMVLHGDVQPNSLYNPISPQQIAASGLDYLALGHVHSQQIEKAGKTLWAYPGCFMGRGFDECGPKGVIKAELSETGCRAEFIPLDVRRYEILSLEAGDAPYDAILAALPEDARKHCCRIVLTGESEPFSCEALERQLAERFYSLSLRDRTVPKRRLWEAAGEDSLRGLFLQDLKAQFDAADEDEKKKLAMAAQLTLDLMDGREVAL